MTRVINVISLGAGVQSSALTLMAARGELSETPDFAVFADVGWEPPRVYEHLQWLEKECKKYGLKIIRASKGNLRKDFLESLETGKRAASIPVFVKKKGAAREGMLRRQCTREYKVDVVRKAIRDFLGYGPRQRIKEHVNLWMGISTDEITRVKPSPIKYITHKYPLIERGMSRLDCLEWMRKNGYPMPPKSACIGCPYHSDEYWKQLKEKYPEEFADAVDFDRALRKKPRPEGELYLHRSCQPLDKVDFSIGQESLFDNECEGMCGI